MNKNILFGLIFLILTITASAISITTSSISETSAEDIENLVKESGCQTNDMWHYHGECFDIPGPDCWLCYSCWGPFCSEPRYCGCGQYVC